MRCQVVGNEFCMRGAVTRDAIKLKLSIEKSF